MKLQVSLRACKHLDTCNLLFLESCLLLDYNHSRLNHEFHMDNLNFYERLSKILFLCIDNHTADPWQVLVIVKNRPSTFKLVFEKD